MKRKLSVCLITYNHENFIKKTIDSILMQITNFDFDIVIADDFSTDSTRYFINEFKHKYYEKISLIYQKVNVGAHKNWLDLLNYSKSEYIAYIEGDDYWIDPYKLQKQVDFLDANLNYNLCFTRAYKLIENELIPIIVPYNESNDYDLVDLYDLHLPITSCTVVFRNIKLPTFLNREIKCGDIALYTALSLNSKIKLIDSFTSVYRIHSGGVWQGISTAQQIKNKLQLYKIIFSKVDDQIKEIILNQTFSVWIRDLIYLKNLNKNKFVQFSNEFSIRLFYSKFYYYKILNKFSRVRYKN
jgi:glycosyltransferase involved in cell wall biosynthesis